MGFLLIATNVLFTLQAAGTQATVTGVVRDEQSGEPLAGAVVGMPDLNRATTTDGRGRYVLRDVPPGPQHISVRFIGHAHRALHALVPASGQLEIDVALAPQPVQLSTLEVHAAPTLPLPGLSGDSSGTYDRGTSMAEVRNNPLLAEPDALQGLEGGPVAMRLESPGGVHVRGGESDQTGYLLDGVPVFSPYHAAGQVSSWNPDALSGVYLAASVPLPGYADALAGTIAASTLEPGSGFGTQGGLSTTQARLTTEGTIGAKGGSGGAGYLISLRTRIPGLPSRDHDPTYLRGESGDLLAKLEAPLGRGRMRLLGYDSGNEIEATADASGVRPGRNTFEWTSRSFGAEWSGSVSGAGLKLLAWRASSDANSSWAAPDGHSSLTATRRDLGALGTIEMRSGTARTTAGIRLEQSNTSYRVKSGSTGPSAREGRTPIATLFGQQTRPLGSAHLTLGASLAAASGDPHFAPYAKLLVRPADRLSVSGSYVRSHQFAQSVRNPESVVGNIFPADLYLGSGIPGVPVAGSDAFVLAAEYVPFAGARIAMEGFRRTTGGLLLVAPVVGGPFSSDSFAVGSGSSAGLSFDAALSRARYGLVASYGLQRVRLEYGESGYVPDHGTTHRLQGGVIVFPSPTISVRLGANWALGRRTTPLAGAFEWEACNLLDQGCEFAGSPYYNEAIGSAHLPAYFRLDLGVRKHWHFQVAGRDAMVAVYGTVTNLLNRKNVLTYARDPNSGRLVPVDMRPLAPLVVGLDWRF